uniref:Cobalt/zinc/cadmium efflux RND transporter membrane fusion protein CzcB family n=1 Tax=Pseudomonas syringae pv. actinidiae TaxID=103796 RepID=A0A2P0QER0_PSESF|nr:efflux RND transporter periplasmic adaptor subunit [Pseudomonas syringae]ARO44853.1 Cobalt/zinc/cadmium efflux RND transporter membrane fusion protein CzcB family [Pseudomonas syringae pv. actinidiae]
MENRRSITAALAVVAIIGLGFLTTSKQSLPLAAESESRKQPAPESSQNDVGSKGHGGVEDAEHGHGQGNEEQSHDEEGKIELTAAQIDAAGIEVAAATPRSMTTSVTFPGEIRFDEDRTTHVVPRVNGIVDQVNVELGESVKKGQVLAVIASQQITDLRSELEAAQRRTELARLTMQREKKLWEDKISAEQDYLLARQTYQEADISMANARQKLNAIGATVKVGAGNRYELIAPFDSVVVEKHLGIGEVVTEATAAFTLSDLTRVWATFGVAPKDLKRVVVGRAVKVSAPDLDAQVDGRVSYVGSLLGEQTRAATVRVVLPNPNGAWRPGLFVSIDVTADKGDAKVAIPESSIQTIEDKPSVFVRDAEGFRLQTITTGRRDNGYVEILSGLDAGMQVAATGSFILKSELGKSSAEHAH